MGDADGIWLMAGIVALSIGLGLVVGGTLAEENSVLRRLWNTRAALDGATLKFVRSPISGHVFVALQLLALLASGLAALLEEDVFLVAIGVGIVGLMRASLARQRRKRIATIEAQLDTWLGSLANALRSTPSMGEALAVTTEVIRGPISEEIDTLLKQTKVGLALDRALLDLADRIGSPLVTTALASLLVGRQTGGDVPAILQETSAGLREMTRLQGVLDAKTSESRMQAYVMLGIPFVVLLAIHRIDAAWLEPLSSSSVGLIASSIAAVLWIAAVVLARRILDVSM